MNIIAISNQSYPKGMAGTMRIRLFTEYFACKELIKVLNINKDNGINPKTGTYNKVEYRLFYNWKYFLIIPFVYPLLVLRFLIKEKKRKKKNILFIYDGLSILSIQFAIIGKWLGYKVVTDVVEDYTLVSARTKMQKLKLYFHSKFIRLYPKLIDGTIVISKYLDEKYRKLMGSEKVIYISISAKNIVDTFKKDKRSNRISFLYAGSYGQKDGVENLIDAFGSIHKEFPQTSLLLVGKLSQNITEYVENCNGVEIIGFLPDEEFYKFITVNADVLCMNRTNSLYANAGFPFKLGEYLATGNAVMASEVSNISDYLENKKDILFYEASNQNALINAMKLLITDDELREEIGKNGYLKCVEYFNPATNGKKALEFLAKI